MSSPRELRIAAQSAPITDLLLSAFSNDSEPLHVVLEPGVHQCGGLRLRSFLTLEIVEGAELHFLSDWAAYADTTVSIVAEESNRAMIVATGQQDIAVIGKGRIVCNGSTAFSNGDDGEMGTLVAVKDRPRLMVIDGCRNVRVAGLEIDDSPMWTLHFADCDNVEVTDVSVDNNRRMPNTDAVVIDGSRHVRLERCTLRTADDGVVLKTTRRENGVLTGACDDIVVKDCVVESHSCALKLGTESFAPFRNITFENIRLEGSNRGLGIFSRDGGVVENVRFSNITLDCHETPAGYWGSGEAVTINTIDRRPEEGPAGYVRGVLIENVKGSMEGAINIVAQREGDISGVTLRDINLAQVPGALGTGLNYDIRPTPADRFENFPDDRSVGRVNAWRFGEDGKIIGLIEYPGGMPGVFTKGVSDLTLERVEITRPDPLPVKWNEKLVVQD